MHLSQMSMRDIQDHLSVFQTQGLAPEVARFVQDLIDTVGQLRHDYAICHNDAVVNARYASELERRLEECCPESE